MYGRTAMRAEQVEALTAAAHEKSLKLVQPY